MVRNMTTGEVHFVDHWPGSGESDLDEGSDEDGLSDGFGEEDGEEHFYGYTWPSYSEKKTASDDRILSPDTNPRGNIYTPHGPKKPEAGTGKDAGGEKEAVQKQKASETSGPEKWEPERKDSDGIWKLVLVAALSVLGIFLFSAVLNGITYNKGVQYFNEGAEYYRQEAWAEANAAFSKAVDCNVEDAKQWAYMSKVRYEIQKGQLAYATVTLMEMRDLELPDEMRKEADALYEYVRLELERQQERFIKNNYAGVQGNSSTGNSKSSSGSRKSSSGSSSKKKSSDPYGASDYAHPDDFYYDYYDDFWDYEDAEDYWEEYG